MAAELLILAADKRLKRQIRIERYIADRTNPLEVLLPHKVKEKFHFCPETIYYLCDLWENKLSRTTKRSMALPPLLQILVALRFFATGSYFRVIGDTLGVSKSTVCLCVDIISNLLVKRSSKEISFPSMTSLVNVKTAFKAIGGIPNICGIVDGCFIRIKKPTENTHEFMCRKKFAAINIQVCELHIHFSTGMQFYCKTAKCYKSTKSLKSSNKNMV